MWFAVLGSLNVRNDADVALPSNSVRLRTLLAALLCHPGRAISAEALAIRLWGEQPPESARGNLQVYVHRLRAVLGPDRLIRDYHGYRLVIQDEDEVDAWVFERLVEQGHEARLRGDPRGAAAHYRAALDCWHGPFAYQDVAEFPELVAERDRLAELRVAALEARIEADLSCGEGKALIEQLRTLVREHPLRERFRAQAMLALQRAGQTEEALAVYREFERLLLHEHGLEPGPPLQRLAERIADDDLEPQPTPESTIPAQLPAEEVPVTGRSELLEEIAATLVPQLDEVTANPSIVVLSGLGGVGKSTVALRASHSISYAFPDGQLYANLMGATPGRKPEDPLSVLSGFLRALGEPTRLIPTTVDEASARFRTLTTNRRILVLLDDASDIAQIRPLLPGAGSAVVVTARPVLTALDGAVTLTLQPLPVEQAVQMLTRDLGEDRVAAEPGAAAEIARLAGGLPLALRIVGARLVASGQSLTSFTGDLAAGRDLLSELDQADIGVRASFEVSYQALSDAAADLFDVFGVLDLPDISGQAIQAVLDAPPARVRRLLDELVEAQLLRPVAGTPDRYSPHDLIRWYARHKAAEHLDAERRAELIRRLLFTWIATGRAATAMTGVRSNSFRVELIRDVRLDVPGRTFDTADDMVDWIRAEVGNVVPLARLAAELPAKDSWIVASMASQLHSPMHSQSFAMELIELNLLVLDQVGSTLENEHPAMARALHRDLIHGFLQSGRLDDVLLYAKSEIEVCRRQGDLPNLASVYQALGLACSNLPGRGAEAREALETALELHGNCGNRQGEANAMNNLGNLALRNNDLDEARRWFEQAHARCAADGSEHVLATITANLGEVHQRAGRPHEAIRLYTEAIEASERIGYTRLRIVRSWDLGDLLHQMGEPERAREHWRQALELAIELGQITPEQAEAVLAHPVPPMPSLMFRF